MKWNQWKTLKVIQAIKASQKIRQAKQAEAFIKAKAFKISFEKELKAEQMRPMKTVGKYSEFLSENTCENTL